MRKTETLKENLVIESNNIAIHISFDNEDFAVAIQNDFVGDKSNKLDRALYACRKITEYFAQKQQLQNFAHENGIMLINA